jgi:hypothetical protein
MADSFILTDGTTSFELVYDAGTQDDYKLEYGTRVQLSEPAVLMHSPDDGESLPIRAVDRDREVYLTANLPGDDWDTILDNITKIKRLVDGADSQALRYWTQGDVNRVVLRIQKDGSTNYTDLPVKFGFVDDSGVYYTTIQTKVAWKPVIMLMVAPYGEGAQITLRNDLASSPHFVEDSDGDGLADGWVSVNVPTTLTSNVSNYLVGGRSQQVVGDSLEGIESDVVTATTPSIAAYAWIRPYGGAVSFRIKDSTGNVVTKVLTDGDTGSVSDKTTVSLNGTTWYRVSYSGTLTGNNPQIQVLSNVNGGAFLVDACYLQTGTTTIPDAWCSTSSIENRNDPDAGNEDQISYFDVWNVPGDVNALGNWDIDVGTLAEIYHIYQVARPDAWQVQHWIESSDFSASTWSSGTGTTNNHYSRLPTGQNTGTIEEELDFEHLAKQPLRIYAIARSSSTTPTVRVDIAAGAKGVAGEVLVGTEDVSATATNTWELRDLGLVNLTGAVDGSVNLTVRVEVEGNSGQTTDIDAIILAPAGDESVVVRAVDRSGAAATSVDIEIDGTKRRIKESVVGLDTPFNGSLWYLRNSVMNRFIFMLTAQDTQIEVDATADIQLTVTPRARHLLGTI